MESQSSLLAVEDLPASRLGLHVDPRSDDAAEPEAAETLSSLLACIEAEVQALRRGSWGDGLGPPARGNARSPESGADAPGDAPFGGRSDERSRIDTIEDLPTSRRGQLVGTRSHGATGPEVDETLNSLLACIEAEVQPLRRSLWRDESGPPALDEDRAGEGGADAPVAGPSGDGVRAEPHAEEEATPPVAPEREPESEPRRDEQSTEAQAEELGPEAADGDAPFGGRTDEEDGTERHEAVEAILAELRGEKESAEAQTGGAGHEVPDGDAPPGGRADEGSGISRHQGVVEILVELRGEKETGKAHAPAEATRPPAPQPEPGVEQPFDDSPSGWDGGEKDEAATRVARPATGDPAYRPASRTREAVSATPRSSLGISRMSAVALFYLYPLMLLVFMASTWLNACQLIHALTRLATGRSAEPTELAISEEEQRIRDGFLEQIRQSFALSEPSDEAAAHSAATSFLQFLRARRAGHEEAAEKQAQMARDCLKGIRPTRPPGEGETTEPKATATEWATALLGKMREADARARPATSEGQSQLAP